MQNRYVGDVGDYGKYVLLRRLARSDIRLGVVWCLNSVEEENTDGNLRDYLKEDHNGWYKKFDPHVFKSLRSINKKSAFHVSVVKKPAVFPVRRFFSIRISTKILIERNLRRKF